MYNVQCTTIAKCTTIVHIYIYMYNVRQLGNVSAKSMMGYQLSVLSKFDASIASSKYKYGIYIFP